MKKKLLCLLLVSASVLSLAACGGKSNDNETSDPATTPDASQGLDVNENWDGAYIEADDFKAYISHDLDQIVIDIQDYLTADQASAVNAAAAAGKDAIVAAGTVLDVEKAYDAAYQAILDCIPKASGIVSYSDRDDQERLNMLAILETYAYRTGSTGLSLYENGNIQMYNDRVIPGTENYIPGYGFGTLAEGSITADLEYESNDAWKRYYHTLNPTDPGTLNYLNSKDSDVGDFYSHISAGYYGSFMNATKDGYDWVPVLAIGDMEALNDDDGNGTATKWRMQVRTGAEGLKYTTGSAIASRAAFNNRDVELEDYLTPYKLLLTQSNKYFRGTEMAKSDTGAIVGVKEFYNGTANGFNQALWDKVGVKAYEEDGKSYLEIEFTQELTPFYAMYYSSSSLYMPIPQDFLDLVTVQNYLGFNIDATESPLDNSLSLGSYYLETYNQDQEIVYKKNPNYVYADTKYSIEGIHYRILPAITEDVEASFNEFLAGHTDAASIPQARLDEYRNDPRARKTTGDTVFKLNMNALSAEDWEKMFGEDGTVAQTPKDEYWEVKPVLNNAHFRKGLMYSVDRQTFANARGSIATVDYFSSDYLWNPVEGLSYDNSDEHKRVIAPLVEETDGYGYSLELAREYFRVALSELEAEGAYTPGTAENPTVITIEIAWMYPQHEENYHNEVKSYLETAFNDASVSGGKYQLNVEFWVGNDWSDVYYNKMMVGQFDLGFGSIGGNTLNPLDFMNVLSNDQNLSNGFTLSWGADTNDADSYPIVYDGQRFSYDALYRAANTQAIVADGNSQDALTFSYEPITKNEDGSYSGAMEITATLADQTTVTVTDVVCCNYERYYYGDNDYNEASVEFEVEDKGNGVIRITFTVPAELAADYATGSGTSEQPSGATGFDFYYDYVLNGKEIPGQYYSTDDNFVVE